MRAFFTVFLLGMGMLSPVWATTAQGGPPCSGTDNACLFKELQKATEEITDKKWRDISYRELAKSLAEDNRLTDAIAILPKIENPDTRALTIRGIGMAAAGLSMTPEQYDELFKTLALEADRITHVPSKDIAYTYIAMSQSFAKQDDDAVLTAEGMTNPDLKHKALGEIAEVQAERKDAAAALATLKKIDSQSYRNKASLSIAKLLADRALLTEAAEAANGINGNPTLRAEAFQYIITKQKQKSE